jgi:hypothetical protein
MILNNRCRIFAWLLSIAFVLPIIIKAEHLMFPNHEHHGHSCSHNSTDFENICEIQEFDYFYFTPASITIIPAITIFKFEILIIESIQKSRKESKLPYSLRAPPFIVS